MLGVWIRDCTFVPLTFLYFMTKYSNGCSATNVCAVLLSNTGGFSFLTILLSKDSLLIYFLSEVVVFFFPNL